MRPGVDGRGCWGGGGTPLARDSDSLWDLGALSRVLLGVWQTGRFAEEARMEGWSGRGALGTGGRSIVVNTTREFGEHSRRLLTERRTELVTGARRACRTIRRELSVISSRRSTPRRATRTSQRWPLNAPLPPGRPERGFGAGTLSSALSRLWRASFRDCDDRSFRAPRGRGIQPQVEGISSHSGNLGELKLGKTRGYTRYSAGAPAAFLSRQDRKAPNTARQHSPV